MIRQLVSTKIVSMRTNRKSRATHCSSPAQSREFTHESRALSGTASVAQSKPSKNALGIGCGGRTCTFDLKVMGLASCSCSTAAVKFAVSWGHG